MLIAALTPFLLLRVIPLSEAAGHAALHRGAARGAVGAMPGARTGGMVVRQFVLSGPTGRERSSPGPQDPRGGPADSEAGAATSAGQGEPAGMNRDEFSRSSRSGRSNAAGWWAACDCGRPA